MPGAAISAGVSAAGSLGGALIQSGAAKSAAKAQANASAQQLAFQKQVYTDAQGNLKPAVDLGSNAGTALAGLLGTGGDPAAAQEAFKNYLDSTNYKFTLGQGLNGIEYANAPAFNSGATAKALNQYATGMAGNALSGYESLLQGQQGLGVNAGAALNGVGVNLSQQEANSTNAAAAASGAASINSGNAWASALRGLSNQVGNNSSYISNAFGGLFKNGGGISTGGVGGGTMAGASDLPAMG